MSATLITSGFDELQASNPTPDSGVSAQALFDGEGLKIRHFAFAAGGSLPEHTAPVPIVVQVLDGVVTFSVDGADHRLSRGGTLTVNADVAHSVHAEAPARLMVTLIGEPHTPHDHLIA